MGNVIQDAGQVTPGWLTAALRKQGALTQGEVTEVTAGAEHSAFASAVSRLEVVYSADATPGAPKRLFLKTANPALAPGTFDLDQLKNEFLFYSEIAPAMAESFSVPCYDAAYVPETGASHILLKDVAETHLTCVEPVLQNCRQAVAALAHLHAFWWDHPRLGKDVGKYPTLEERRQDCVGTQQSANAFMNALGEQLPGAWRAVYERVLPALPRLFERHATGRNLTLVHGDAHLGNFLFPKDAGTGSAYLIDWQFWHPTIGGTDLAFMMAVDWEPEIRRKWEGPLLEHYYTELRACGVKTYAWEDCWNDYRLSVILESIFIPVWQWAVFHWAPNLTALERSMTAFIDLSCSDLLD